MATNVEYCIEVISLANELAELLRVLPQALLLLQELGRFGILLEHLHTAWIQW